MTSFEMLHLSRNDTHRSRKRCSTSATCACLCILGDLPANVAAGGAGRAHARVRAPPCPPARSSPTQSGSPGARLPAARWGSRTPRLTSSRRLPARGSPRPSTALRLRLTRACEGVAQVLSSVRAGAELPSAGSGPGGLVLGGFCRWVCSSPVGCLAPYHVSLEGDSYGLHAGRAAPAQFREREAQGRSAGDEQGALPVTAPEGIAVALTPRLPARPAGSPGRPLAASTALPSLSPRPSPLSPCRLWLAPLTPARLLSLSPARPNPLALNSLSPALRVAPARPPARPSAAPWPHGFLPR